MSDLKWTGEILLRLTVRDAFEQRDSDYYSAFTDMVSHLRQKAGTNEDESVVRSENVRLHQEIDKVVASLNSSAVEIEKLLQEKAKNDGVIANLHKTIDKSNVKIQSLNMEIKEKNKTIELINDELLVLQMQVKVLTNSVQQLTAENENLIQRWMDKVSEDAEKLNDANQFLSSIHR